MAYAVSGLTVIGRAQNNGSLWLYQSADSLATIAGGGYFNLGAALVRAGDLITVVASDGPSLFSIASNNGTVVVITGLSVAGSLQPLDAELTAIAGLTSAANQLPYFTGSGAAALTPLTAFIRTLLDDPDQATAQITLGIGAGAQPLDAELTAIAGLASAADTAPYFTGSAAAALMTVTALARTLLDDTTQAAMRTTLGLVPGTDVQTQDVELTALAGVSAAADALPYFTSPTAATVTTLTAFARTILDDTTAAAVRTTIGVDTSTLQPLDAELSALAGLASANNTLPYFTGSGTAALTNLSAFGRTLIAGSDAAATQTTLGLVPGTNVQAQDAELTALAGLTSAADRLPYFTGLGAAALATLTAFARTLLDDADAATMRTTLGVQPLDAELTALAGLTSAADSLPYFTGASAAALATLTTFARTLLDDIDAAAMRTTLGLGTAATAASSSFQATDATLDAMAALDGATGLLEQTGIDVFAKRALGVAAGTSIPTRADADTRYATAAHTHIGSISGQVETVTNKTYILDEAAPVAYTINSLARRTASGTVTAAIQINGTNVTGLSALSCTSTQATATASAANAVAIGNRVTLVTTGNAAAIDLAFTLKVTV